MANLTEATQNLIDLIEGKYNKVPFEGWGMKEFDDYEERYLSPLSGDERISVFSSAYKILGSNDLEEHVKQIFYLASVYGVKFSNDYFTLLENETDSIKRRIFFSKMRYYIEDRWSESQKKSLTDHQKMLLKKYCNQYGLDLPY